MRTSTLLQSLPLAAAAATALIIPAGAGNTLLDNGVAASIGGGLQKALIATGLKADEEQYLVELAPGQTQWVTEAQKWALRRVS